MAEEINLGPLDGCLVLTADHGIGIILPKLTEEEGIPQHLQILIGLFMWLSKEENIVSTLDYFDANIETFTLECPELH